MLAVICLTDTLHFVVPKIFLVPFYAPPSPPPQITAPPKLTQTPHRKATNCTENRTLFTHATLELQLAKIASSCRDKNPLCKRAFMLWGFNVGFYHREVTNYLAVQKVP